MAAIADEELLSKAVTLLRFCKEYGVPTPGTARDYIRTEISTRADGSATLLAQLVYDVAEVAEAIKLGVNVSSRCQQASTTLNAIMAESQVLS